MDLYFIDANGNPFVVPDAPENYTPPQGATPISPPPSPAHRWINGAWRMPPVEPQVPGQSLTYKADVWRRATDAQAAVIDTELQKLDVRRRRMWDDAMYLDHADELVVFFRTMLTQTFGAAEADRILAPSNV